MKLMIAATKAGKKELEWLFITFKAAGLAITVAKACISHVTNRNVKLMDGSVTEDTVNNSPNSRVLSGLKCP